MVLSTEPLDVARKCFEVLSVKDFATVAAMLADDIVWRRPGVNQFSGTRRGGEVVGEMLGAANGSLVAAPSTSAGRPSPCRPLDLGQHLNRPTTTPA